MAGEREENRRGDTSLKTMVTRLICHSCSSLLRVYYLPNTDPPAVCCGSRAVLLLFRWRLLLLVGLGTPKDHRVGVWTPPFRVSWVLS